MTPRARRSGNGGGSTGRGGRTSAIHESRRERETKLLYADTIETITALMHEQGVSQRELARRLGRSEPWISRVLNARGNTTLKTVAELGWALGLRFGLAPLALPRAETPAAGDPPLPDWVGRHARRAARGAA